MNNDEELWGLLCWRDYLIVPLSELREEDKNDPFDSDLHDLSLNEWQAAKILVADFVPYSVARCTKPHHGRSEGKPLVEGSCCMEESYSTINSLWLQSAEGRTLDCSLPRDIPPEL